MSNNNSQSNRQQRRLLRVIVRVKNRVKSRVKNRVKSRVKGPGGSRGVKSRVKGRGGASQEVVHPESPEHPESLEPDPSPGPWSRPIRDRPHAGRRSLALRLRNRNQN